ncbi:putative colanic acid biosynthesis protein, partial [Salmonella enterica subsp. enterica serovar Newport str. WA_14881]
MPATKFSRRTLLTAGSALAVLPFLRALPVQAREPRETVDIKDYPADDGIASFNRPSPTDRPWSYRQDGCVEISM